MSSTSIPKITDYELQDKIGSGSYAKVYKAKEKKTNLYNAIKVVEKATLSRSARDNLITEIQLLKSLNHKHIVGLSDFFWDEKHIYIVLEYCNLGSLYAFIRIRNVLPENTCKYFMRQLGSAMQYMRANNVSHFDLKPQNLLLTRSPNVILKVADFGFAQHLQLHEVNSSMKGSLLYMAPEIILKHSYDATADLWSIGVILYECLFGFAPYISNSLEELLLRIKVREKILIPKNTKISSECEDLMTGLLQHDPEKRISFEKFFSHPFINLKYFPSDDSLKIAISLVTKAIENDEKENFKEAYHLYCKALQYFVPLIMSESDAVKRQHLRVKVSTYMNRAEELNTMLLRPQLHHTLSAEMNAPSSQDINHQQHEQCLSDHKLLHPIQRFKTLYILSSSSPQLKDALDIGRKGEMYIYEKNFIAGLENLKSALNIMVPFLGNEPNGERKNLLIQQIDYWMNEAENIQAWSAKKEIENDTFTNTLSNCKIQ